MGRYIDRYIRKSILQTILSTIKPYTTRWEHKIFGLHNFFLESQILWWVRIMRSKESFNLYTDFELEEVETEKV